MNITNALSLETNSNNSQSEYFTEIASLGIAIMTIIGTGVAIATYCTRNPSAVPEINSPSPPPALPAEPVLPAPGSSSEAPNANRLRELYPTFEAYRQEREASDEPVDLIIGRGTRIYGNDPILHSTRFHETFEFERERPYQPFTIDTDANREPDLLIGATQLTKALPDASVDEIYLERVFPAIYANMRFYYEAARVLKVGGQIIIDYNDGFLSKEAREKIKKLIQNSFQELGLPFFVDHYEADNKTCQKKYTRNNLDDCAKLVCLKCDELVIPTKQNEQRFRGLLLQSTKALEEEILAMRRAETKYPASLYGIRFQ